MAGSFFEEIQRYVGFTERDAALLRALRPAAAPHFPQVADRFYERLLAHEAARRVITDGPSMVDRLKRTLVGWMEGLFTGPFDEAYYQLRARIGRRHVEVGVPQRFMITAMNGVRMDFVVIAHDAIPHGERLFGTLYALHKILDLELAIMLQTYKEDSDARLLHSERTRADERIRAIETLVAGLAHEVRNPVNAAALQLALLRRRAARLPDCTTLLEPLGVAQTELQRLEELVRSLMEFARPSLGMRSACDVGDLVRAAVAAHGGLAEARRVGLRMESEDSLPRVAGDAGRLKQVFDNLVRNAVEAMGPGGTATARAAKDGGGVVVTVTDEGAGIPAEMLDRVFDPFFTTKDGGAGLGLSIAQTIVREHGGDIRIRSEPDRGTTVEVRLPAR